jgi:hypothetical protein
VLPDEDVFDNRHAAEELQVLERPGDAGGDHLVSGQPQQVETVEQDRATAGFVDAGDAVEHRGLARFVRPNESQDLTWLMG